MDICVIDFLYGNVHRTHAKVTIRETTPFIAASETSYSISLCRAIILLKSLREASVNEDDRSDAIPTDTRVQAYHPEHISKNVEPQESSCSSVLGMFIRELLRNA